MIMNIVVNARDAMPNGGKITIETANVELDEAYVREHAEAKLGPHVMLAITDTGLGMDAETRAHIFEPFFTTKGVGKGTGLGLSTVYGIVKQSEGSIWVYSEPGRGTTFKIYVPRAEGAAEPLKRPVAAAEVSRGTETILLVEDDEGVRKLICDVLRSNGYTVMVSEDGEKAVEICKQHEGPIHLLLTDVVLPKMGGPEIAKRLLARRPSMKVLYMSGYADKAIVHNGVLEEGIAFLGKPVSPQALLSKVREVLEKSTG